MSVREKGSSGLTVMVALVSAGMGYMYVQQSSQKTKNVVDQAKVSAELMSREISDNSSLARFRALISNKKMPDGSYEPGIYPVNYFDANWVLQKNNNVMETQEAVNKGVDTRDDAVKVKVKSSKKLKSDGAAEKFISDAEAEQYNEEKTIKINKVNFEAGKPALVSSLDVEVRSEGDKAVRARINVPPPVGSNPILELRSPGGAWTRNFAKLSPGNYQGRVLASGVVLEAEVFINGMFAARVGGFDLNGKVSHQAVNPLAKEKEIGQFNYEFKGSTDFVFNAATCSSTPTDGSFHYSITLVSPDGGREKKDFPSPIVVSGFDSSQDLSDQQFKDVCSAQCPWVDDVSQNIDEYRANQVETGRFNDFSWKHHLQITRRQIGSRAYKACESIKDGYEQVKGDMGGFLGGLGKWDVLKKIFEKGGGMANGWTQLEYVAYKEPECKRRFLFKRNSCGCFADDTKIRLEDGSEKAITQLTENDRVWNPVTKKGQAIRRMTQGPEKVPMFRIVSAGKEVLVTGTHPFETRNGLMSAFQMQVGQDIRSTDGSWVKVDGIGIKPMEGQAPVVWNLELEGSNEDPNQHFVEANGVVTGDLYLQIQLQNKKALSAQKH